jgi:ABC-type antimicrobial peptide transport system permease subunit
VVAYTTALRTKEVGIRMALGASPRIIVGTVLYGAMVPLTAGLIVGVAAALILSRLLSSLLYETSSMDLGAYLSATALLLTLGIIASMRPAWRAATADPLHSLRTE